MKQCGAFIAFGTIDYAEPTGNPAACNEELAYWRNTIMKNDPSKKLIPARMIRGGWDFKYVAAKVLFGTGKLELCWTLGEEMPRTFIADLIKALGSRLRPAA